MSRKSPQRRFASRTSRRAAALIALITFMSVTAVLGTVWARKLLTERRHQRHAEEVIQVNWLVDSGLRRAAAQLVGDPQFQDEQWRIPAADLQRSADAQVTLHAESVDDPAGAFRISVEVRYPAEQPRIKRSRSLIFTPPNSEPAS